MFTARSLRPISGTTLFFFLWMTLYPAVSAAIGQDQATPPVAQAAQPSEPDTLDSLRELAGRAHAKADRGEDESDEEKQLLKQADKLDAEEQQAEAEFAATRQHLEDHHLPDEIKQRHAEALAEYRAKMRQLKQLAQGFKAAHGRKDKAAARQQMKEMADFLVKEQKHRQHQPFDPKHLPFGTPDGNVRAPKENKQELDGLVRPPQAVAVAANELLPGMLAQNDPGATPTADDLAATEDAPLTDAIKAQAAALHHNPVEIYNWVRNSVEFLPTYGSIQGGDLTLQTLRGNAFDTASLLVALLRASNIPARYAYGTIQVPAAQVMNWVGGVTTPEAAQDLLGQGGIPTIAVKAGGKIAAFRLEHVWVEAFVDYIPSRGAVNKQGDTWIPLDAAFKQYSYTQGMDIKAAVPFDAQGMINQVQQGATANEAEGWVQGLNETALQSTLVDYKNRVQLYLEQHNPDATLADVLGDKTIIDQTLPILTGTLPYQVVVASGRYPALADSLRHKATLTLYATALDAQLGAPAANLSISLAKLGNSRLGVSYEPASDSDRQLLDSYRQKAAKSLPAYLIRLRPVITVDGETLVTGPVVTMADIQYWSLALPGPSRPGTPDLYTVAAGDEMVFGINGAGITPNRVIERIAAVDPDHDAAENLQQVALHYWLEHDQYDQWAARAHGVVAYRLPSAGRFFAPLAARYFFGIARSASYNGRAMDVKRVQLSVAGGGTKARVGFMMQSGMQGSYFEASVFDQLFRRPAEKAISAAQILRLSNRQGIRLYAVTAANLDTVLPRLAVDGTVKADIRNAVARGQAAFVPERDITHNGWTGTGYVLLDPATGAAAYLLEGGTAGSFAPACAEAAVPLPARIAFNALERLRVGAISATRAAGGRLAGVLAEELIGVEVLTVAGGGATVAIGLAAFQAAIAVSIVVTFAYYLYAHLAQYAIIEAGMAGAPEATDCECAPEPKPEECDQCDFRNVGYHRGGDPIHDACAESLGPNLHPLSDTDIVTPSGSKSGFDWVFTGKTRACEVKTLDMDNLKKYNSFVTMMEINKEILEARLQAQIAAACGLQYCFAVSSKRHQEELEKRRSDLPSNIELIYKPECGVAP